MDNEKMKVYGYYVCLCYDKGKDFLSDRGITFGEDLTDAMTNIEQKYHFHGQEIIHIEIMEVDCEYLDPAFSIYEILSEFTEKKEIMEREMREEWSLI